jgi:hypothetical protein
VAGTDFGDTIVLDVDATLVTVHSEKESVGGHLQGRHRLGRRGAGLAL